MRKHLTEKMAFEQKPEEGGEVSHVEFARRKFQVEERTVYVEGTGRRSVGPESN